MAYTNQDKYAFAIKDARYSISMGMGNALSNSVEWVKNNSLYEKLSEEALKAKIEEYVELFFHLTQVKIEQKYSEWLELNDEHLKELFDIQPNPDKTFIQEEQPDLDMKKE